MNFPFALTIFGVLSSSLSLFLGIFVLGRRRTSPGALPFSLMMIANAIYAAAYTIELNAPDLGTAVLWLKMEHFGVTPVPVLWLIFVDTLVDIPAPERSRRNIFLFIVPAITLALVMTNELHRLMYTGYRLADVPGLSVIVASRGPWYWVNALYLYGLLLIGTVRVVRKLFLHDGLFRIQSIVVAIGVLCPWVAHAALIARKGPFSLDPTPFALTVTGACLTVGIFKLGLLDLVPIARDRVFDAIRDGVIVIDIHGRFVDSNRAAKAVFPALIAMKPGKDALPFLESIPLDIDEIDNSVEISLLLADRIRHFRIDTRPIENCGGVQVGTAIIAADTTETTELLSRMAKLATTDELTGAYNRRHFFELAEREMDLARRKDRAISFAMFDLDHFKKINDRYGHSAGDSALRSVCESCRSMLRSTDIFCRYGGEEFVILFPETTPSEAMEIAERLRESIKRTSIQIGARAFSVTASFGICGSDAGPVASLTDYLHRIDEAMYQAKAAGRNRVVLDERKSSEPEIV